MCEDSAGNVSHVTLHTSTFSNNWGRPAKVGGVSLLTAQRMAVPPHLEGEHSPRTRELLHVDDWNPSSSTSTQQPNLSQVNTIGCADEGHWIFSLDDSKKRRHSVNWDETNLTEKWKTEEHELMIDSGCFGHVCPPWFAPQFPMVSSTNVDSVAANNVALQHYGQKVVYGHVMTNSGKRILIQITFDVMNVRKPRP